MADNSTPESSEKLYSEPPLEYGPAAPQEYYGVSATPEDFEVLSGSPSADEVLQANR